MQLPSFTATTFTVLELKGVGWRVVITELQKNPVGITLIITVWFLKLFYHLLANKLARAGFPLLILDPDLGSP